MCPSVYKGLAETVLDKSVVNFPVCDEGYESASHVRMAVSRTPDMYSSKSWV